MNHEVIRRKALLAAATVTLALGPGGGCRGAVDEPKASSVDGDPLPVDSDVQLVDSDRPSETGGAKAPVDSAVSVEAPLPGEDGADPAPPPDCVELGLLQDACCEVLRGWCERRYEADSMDYNECVFGPGFSGSTGCSPWGPPVPPRFSGATA